MTTTRYPPMRPIRLSLEVFAARSRLHPDLVHRFVALGLIEPDTDASGRLWFRPSDLDTAARIERLRTGLMLNYAAIGLIMDLLDEIDDLRASARSAPAGRGAYRTQLHREELIHRGHESADSEVAGGIARRTERRVASRPSGGRR